MLLLSHYIMFIKPFIKSIVCAFTQSSLGIFSLFILLIGITLLFLVLVKLPREPIEVCQVRINVPKIYDIFNLNNNNNEDDRLERLIIIISFLVIVYGLGLSSPIIYNYTISITKKIHPVLTQRLAKTFLFLKLKTN